MPNLTPMKTAIARVMCNDLVGHAVSNVFQDRIPSRGNIIFTSDSRILPSVKASLFWGLYESSEIRFVQKYLRSGLDFIELGASLGVVSSHIARCLRPTCKLICLEANPYLLEQIRQNVEKNSPQSNLIVMHGAIDYSCSGHAAIAFEIGTRNLDSRVQKGKTGNELIRVPRVTLQQILHEHSLTSFGLVCDIEGAEVGLILSERESLSFCKQMIVELHSTVYEGHEYTVDELCSNIQEQHGFFLRDRRGGVCVFER